MTRILVYTDNNTGIRTVSNEDDNKFMDRRGEGPSGRRVGWGNERNCTGGKKFKRVTAKFNVARN